MTEVKKSKKEEIIIRMSAEYGSISCIGAEVTIGKLEQKSVDELIQSLEINDIFEGETFSNSHEYCEIYHNQGIIIPEHTGEYSVSSDISDLEEKSTDNWEFDEEWFDDEIENEKSIKIIDFPNNGTDESILGVPGKGIYLITVRLEDVYGFYYGEREASDEKAKVKYYVDRIAALSQTYNDFTMLRDVKIDGVELTRDVDNESILPNNKIYDKTQFIYKDGELIGCISNSHSEQSYESFFEVFYDENSAMKLPVFHRNYLDMIKNEEDDIMSGDCSSEDSLAYKQEELIRKLKE